MLSLKREIKLLFLTFLISLSAAWTSVQAGTCFAVDDDSNTIITYDSTPPINVRFTTPIPSFGGVFEQIEAAYFDSVTNRYFVVRQSSPHVFGYVDPATGDFIQIGASLGVTSVPTARTLGTDNGSGDRITGLARNPLTNKWYVISRDGYIYEINTITGTFVPGAFSGNDYLRVSTPTGVNPADVEDFAFDNAGKLFVVRNAAQAQQFLQDVSLLTGTAVGAVNLGLNEAEGLSNSIGDIRLIIGAGGSAATQRNFYSVNTATGGLTLLFNVPNPAGTPADFEATGCNDGALRADLRVSKTVGVPAVAPGGTVTFTIGVEHQGIDIAYRITLQDQLDPGLSVVSATISPGCAVCSFDIPTGVWSIDKMDIGQRRTLTLVLSTAGVTPNTMVSNRVQITQQCEAAAGACTPLLDLDSTPNNKAGASWTPTEDDEAIASVLVTVIPSVAKSFNPTSGIAGVTTTLVLTLSNPNSSSSATLTSALTDTYPAGLVNAATPAAATTCGGAGAVTAAAGGNTVSLAAGRVIPAGGACSVSVVVTASSVGLYTNTVPAGALTTTVAGVTLTSVVGTTATYQVVPTNVGVIKSFTLSTIGVGQTTTLRITFSNPTSVTATLSSAFVDTYPTGLVNAATPSPSTTCAGTGTPTAVAGTNTVNLPATRAIPPNASCSVSVVVTASTRGSYTNTVPIGGLSTTVGGNLGASSAVLLVDSPSVSKSFSPNAVQGGGASTLLITFSNPLSTTATFSTTFTDIYPSIVGGTMVNATVTAATDNCPGGNVTAVAQANSVSMPVGTQIPPLSSCFVSVSVYVTPTNVTGTFVNGIPAGSLTTSLGNNASAVTATLTVSIITDLQVTKVASVANATPGQVIGYTVTVVNLGPSVANTATMADALSGVTLSSGVTVTVAGGGSVTSLVTSTSNITATMNLPVNGSATFFFRGLPSIFNGFVTNTAVVSPRPGTTDSNPVNDMASVNTQISPTANLQVTKTNGTITVVAGGTTVYTVTFTNSGPSDASNAVVRDIPSAGLQCTTVTCSVTGGALCGSPSISALAAGYPLPGFPSGSTVTMLVTCRITATGR